MEKDKGLFSFRKHPVGNVLDEKKGRKRKGGRLRRSMGFLMAAALIFSTLPASGLVVSASEQEKGLCEHHRSHTAECGYEEAQPCTHVCSEESGCITKVLDCHHEHDENCGYQEAQDCGYVCEICNGTEPENTENNAENDTENAGTDTAECICETLCTEDSINGDCPVCGAEDADLSRCVGEKTEEQEKTGEKVITAWEWIDPEEYLTDGMLALPGAGRENPAFMEDVTTLLPEKIQAEVVIVNAAEDEEETEEDAETVPETEDAEITLTGWECASYPEDGAYEGTYTFTASLPGGFVLAEDAAALEVEVELGGVEILAETVSVSYQEASWNGGVTYTTKTADSCTPVADSAKAVAWNEGWYVVNSSVTISEPITVTGAVNLILADGCTLDAQKGIVVTTGNSLTIYAQSGGTGTLNATGTADSDNASAGIGGSETAPNSGTITIHGGVINATGGTTNPKTGYSGAGIGGGSPKSGNGGSSGAITIYGGTITANSGAGTVTGAGIGGGGGGTGSNITIYGGSVTAASTGTQSGGAGIGGGGGDTGGTGSDIQIYGGTIKATGSALGAGIGGGGGGMNKQSGDGTVTISGGTVTAIGDKYAAGIGGGGGYYYSSQYGSGGLTGGTGSVTISGGIVDAKGGAGNSSGDYAGDPIGNGGNAGDTVATVNKTNGIVFENGAGTVCGDVTLDGSYTVPGDYMLNIPAGASLSGSGTLSGGGTFTTENLTEDMISVPEDWHYTGEDLTEKIKGAVSLNGEITICGQTFTASTDGWELSVEKVSELEYTVKYTHTDKGTLSKTVTIARGQTALSDVVTYKEDGTTPANTFSVGETIIVKATATFPANNAIIAAAEFDTPTGEQMAVYYNDTQISAPSTVENGVHTMTVDTSNLPESALNKEIALTVKYIESGNASGADTEAKVTVTAAARVEKDGITSYVDKNGLLNAFDIDNGNNGAVITLLEDVELTGNSCISIQIDCTLDFGGHTILADATAVSYAVLVPAGKTVTIRGAGGISGINNSQALQIGGNVTLEGGTFSCAAGSCVSVVSNSASLSVTSPNVRIENTAGRGLRVGLAQSVHLSAGTYSGTTEAITFGTNCSLTLTDLLAEGYAYYNGDTPIALQLDGKELTGTVTVKECNHTGGLVPSENGYQHGGPCQCCGAELTAANHTLGADNQCSGCGAELVAKVEKSSSDTVYVAANGLNAAFAEDSGNAGATFTLLSDVEPNTCLDIQIDCTLDLGGHTITSPTGRSQCVNVQTNATVTIRGEGGITAPSGIALAVNGSVTLEGGTYTGGGNESSSVYVVGQSAMLSVTGEKVSIRNTGGGYGLIVAPAQSVQLSAGTYSGTAGAISSTLNFSDMLAHTENIRYAYYQGDALVTTGLDGQALTGTVTVKACTHAYQYAHTTGATTHSQTCPACGDAKAAETCSYDAATGRCACGSTLAVTLPADLAFTYDGTAKTPAVTVTVDGTPLTEGYSVAYNNNINAGNAAAVTITGTSFTGTVTLTFSIGKATPTIAWSSTSQELTYTGQQAVIIAPTVTLENNENFGGTISYSYKKQGETDYKDGLPTDAGTYTIKAHVDAEGNYNAADSTNELTLVIQKADAAITVGTDTYHKTFGDAAFTLDVTDNNTEADVQCEVTEGTDVVSVENGTVTILNAGTAEIRVSLPASTNYNAAENKTIIVTVDKKSGYTVAVLNRSYYYQDGRTESIDLAALLPKDCGNVTYGEPAVSGNVTYSAAPAVSGGKLSYTLDSGNVDDAGTITVTVVTRNFEDITVTVAITRSACDHEAGEILYTGAGERAPVCAEDGLGHRECTKCGSVVESGIVVEALGHTGGTATCSQRKVCTRCGQPYGDTDDSVHDWHITSEKAATAASEGKRVYTCSGCGKIYEESIPKLPQPTHTHSYGTDWESDSNSHWHECFCGEKAHIAAHTEDGGSVTKPATETETGIRTYKCSVCGYVMRTEVIDKLSSTGSQTETPQEPVTSEQIRKNSEKLDSGIVINVDGNKFNLSWKKVGGAEGYDIFAAPYGKTKLDAKSLIKSVKGNKTSASLAKIDGKKVYQVQIKAWRYVDGKKVYIGSSRVYHVAGKANTKYTNAKKLQPAKEKYALKKGMSIRIKVTVIKQSKKKLLPKSNGSALCYESSNKEIATVTSNGKVKAKKKGTCYITVTALNGVKTKIKIMVK